MKGDIKNKRDLKFAEKYYYEGKGYNFLQALAKKSSNKNVLSSVQITAEQLPNKSQACNIMWDLLDNPNYAYKNTLYKFLLKNLTDMELLDRLKPYCIDATFTNWLNRMQSLGYLSQQGRKRAVNERYPVQNQSSDCYIATACYGSYDCTQVLTFGNFRDEYLSQTLLGRMFIKTYYALSPNFAKWLENKDRINTFIRASFLERIYESLKDKY